MQIERGPSRGLSQAPPGAGLAGNQPQIGDFLIYPPLKQNLKTRLTASESGFFGGGAAASMSSLARSNMVTRARACCSARSFAVLTFLV